MADRRSAPRSTTNGTAQPTAQDRNVLEPRKDSARRASKTDTARSRIVARKRSPEVPENAVDTDSDAVVIPREQYRTMIDEMMRYKATAPVPTREDILNSRRAARRGARRPVTPGPGPGALRRTLPPEVLYEQVCHLEQVTVRQGATKDRLLDRIQDLKDDKQDLRDAYHDLRARMEMLEEDVRERDRRLAILETENFDMKHNRKVAVSPLQVRGSEEEEKETVDLDKMDLDKPRPEDKICPNGVGCLKMGCRMAHPGRTVWY